MLVNYPMFGRMSLAVVAFSACTFDTSTHTSLEDGGIQAPPDSALLDAALPDAVLPDAVLPEVDSEPPLPVCAGYGTQSQPITFLGQINTLPSGRYYFFVDNNLFQGEVSIDERGNSWLMVLNYLHRSTNNANLTVYRDRLPLLSPAPLGSDESNTVYWGHSSNALFAALELDEMRFYARSSRHKRVVHFSTTHADTIDYFATGQGSAQGLRDEFEAYSDHTSALPGNQNNQFSDRDDLAQTNFPFYRAGVRHWGIRGGGYRWEVDDRQGASPRDTLHRTWVRSGAICGDGVLEGQEACDDGNQLAGDGCGCCTTEDI
ncbi:MAG: hypothetical protein JKY56_25210 [Kofleriaceae bacterium]|nr:hypothetical protein [Kofleriaceae bacterium]